MNISKLSLKALRDQINAGTREVTFRTDDGAMTQMVYIPHFRVPAGIWEGGSFPPRDLTLGGFFVDKYQCSHKAATSTNRGIGANPTVTAGSTTDVAVSLPGRVPWTDITWDNAKIAAANRKVNGVACHLMTMKEWFTIVALTKLLGHDIRGNNSWGRDYRDTDAFENYGVKDWNLDSYAKTSGHDIARVLTGSGPVSWAHNGQANGVFDLVGNVSEWIDFTITDGVYRHVKTALVNDVDGIQSGDTAIVINNIQDLASWPTANGLVLIKAEGSNTDEYVIYGSLIDNGNGTATLSNCQRGQNGSTPSTHANNAQVQQLTDYCLVPGGARGFLTAAATATDGTIAVDRVINGPGGVGFTVGDTLQVETEQMLITANNGGGVYAVSRGANGSTAASHAAGKAVIKLSPQMSNALANSPDVTYGSYQFGYLTTLRKEPDLMAMGIPYSANSQTDEYKDGFWARWTGTRAADRGGLWDNGSNARSGFLLDLIYPPSYWRIGLGFRAALTL